MSIKSDAFGRVTLTDRDAKKFKNQVTYGRPKAAAVESVRRGMALNDTYKNSGKIVFKLKKSA
ncbi:MAG: hypothetical protein HQ505_09235 [Nitrosopumilus sp.]|nr:hypothetical protein [Nitrosopumilus sp.]